MPAERTAQADASREMIPVKRAPERHAIRAAHVDVSDASHMDRHWSQALANEPDAAVNKTARARIRNRARYEVANNSYMRGIVETQVNDICGRGPRLQMVLDDLPDACRLIEADFAAWCKAAGYAQKYQSAKRAQKIDGEIYLILLNNKAISHEVPLDLMLVEAEQVDNPWAAENQGLVDGIQFDKAGNPVKYHVKRRQPGVSNLLDQYDQFSASQVIHRFTPVRAGQRHGYSELTPALPLCAHLRAFTLATITAARSAANFSWILGTETDGGENPTGVAWDEIDLEIGMGMVAPDGYKPFQLKAEHPSTTYPQFKREILNEIARCLNMPYNIAAADSSGYNYASGRLDHQTYYKSVRVEQATDADVIHDRVFAAWWAEARHLPRYRFLQNVFPQVPTHQWFFDGTEHVDPSKEAAAQEKRLQNLTTSLSAEYAKLGLDWETEVRQIARERDLLDELKLTRKEAQPAKPDENETDDADKEDDEGDAGSDTGDEDADAA